MGSEQELPAALKEWALVCDMLLDGRMTVLFRKGGINEKGFWVEANEFFLFPTYFHQNRDKVRPEFREEFDRALGAAPPEGTLRIPALARVVDAIPVARNEGVYELEDLHPYTREQIDLRLEFRPKKPLVILAVETVPLRAPVGVPLLDRYGGCSSWVPLEIGPTEATDPVVPRAQIEATAARVRGAVS
ncbi:MAG: DUF1802 family protein [Actinomycetota bacterium]